MENRCVNESKLPSLCGIQGRQGTGPRRLRHYNEGCSRGWDQAHRFVKQTCKLFSPLLHGLSNERCNSLRTPGMVSSTPSMPLRKNDPLPFGLTTPRFKTSVKCLRRRSWKTRKACSASIEGALSVMSGPTSVGMSLVFFCKFFFFFSH